MTTPAHDLEAIRRALMDRLATLRDARSGTAESRKPVELDQTSVGRLSRLDAMQMQEMALAAERRRALELKRVEAAMQRIDAGEFGYCVACGEEIAAKRLAIDPAVATCIRCAAGAES